MSDLRGRIQGGIFGLVVGDALGVPLEFLSRDQARRKHITCMTGPGTHHQPPGTWSDDSSMALCTLASLLEEGYDPVDMMKRFSNWRYQAYMSANGSVFDIGVTTRAAIHRYKEGQPQSCWGGPGERENGNGSLMRILPLSLFLWKSDTTTIIERSFEVSALTHAHARSQLCCAYFSLLIRDLLRGEPLEVSMRSATRHLEDSIPEAERKPLERILSGSVLALDEDDISGDGYVIHTLEASLWCCARHSSYREAVLAAVHLGDDTDTTAAVTGAIAGVLHGLNAIPAEWRREIARSGEVHALAEKFAATVMK